MSHSGVWVLTIRSTSREPWSLTNTARITLSRTPSGPAPDELHRRASDPPPYLDLVVCHLDHLDPGFSSSALSSETPPVMTTLRGSIVIILTGATPARRGRLDQAVADPSGTGSSRSRTTADRSARAWCPVGRSTCRRGSTRELGVEDVEGPR